MNQLRRRIFCNDGGMSRVRPTSSWQRFIAWLKGEGKLYPYWSECFVLIRLAPEQQFSRSHPEFVKRLIQDFGKRLSFLQCSTGGFGRALQRGEVSLGHIWAEIFCLCLDQVSVPLGYGDILFQERFRTIWHDQKGTLYRIRLFYTEPFPAEFSGGEYRVTGYLNAAIAGEPFPINQRLVDAVTYNLLQPENPARRKSPSSKRRQVKT